MQGCLEGVGGMGWKQSEGVRAHEGRTAMCHVYHTALCCAPTSRARLLSVSCTAVVHSWNSVHPTCVASTPSLTSFTQQTANSLNIGSFSIKHKELARTLGIRHITPGLEGYTLPLRATPSDV